MVNNKNIKSDNKTIRPGNLLKTIRKMHKKGQNHIESTQQMYVLLPMDIVTQEIYQRAHRNPFLKILNSESTLQDNYIWLVFFSSLERIIEFNGANTMEITLKNKTTINRNCEYTRLTIVKSTRITEHWLWTRSNGCNTNLVLRTSICLFVCSFVHSLAHSKCVCIVLNSRARERTV